MAPIIGPSVFIHVSLTSFRSAAQPGKQWATPRGQTQRAPGDRAKFPPPYGCEPRRFCGMQAYSQSTLVATTSERRNFRREFLQHLRVPEGTPGFPHWADYRWQRRGRYFFLSVSGNRSASCDCLSLFVPPYLAQNGSKCLSHSEPARWAFGDAGGWPTTARTSVSNYGARKEGMQFTRHLWLLSHSDSDPVIHGGGVTQPGNMYIGCPASRQSTI